MGSQNEAQYGLLNAKKANLTKTIMHMFMRAGVVESCVMKVMEIVHSTVMKLGPAEDVMENVFNVLLLDGDAINQSEFNTCLTGPAGT